MSFHTLHLHDVATISHMAAARFWPAIAQEALLPEGFGNPAETPAPKSSPAPGSAPTPTPAPTNVAAPPSVAPTLGTTTVTPAADAGEEEEEGEEVESDRKSTRLNSSH